MRWVLLSVSLLLIGQLFVCLLFVSIPRPEVYLVVGKKVPFAAASPELYLLLYVQVQ